MFQGHCATTANPALEIDHFVARIGQNITMAFETFTRVNGIISNAGEFIFQSDRKLPGSSMCKVCIFAE